jgi:glucokinase
MWQEFSHVSVERLVSGPGIAYLYRALADIYGFSVGNLQPQQIVQRARANDDLSLKTIQVFSQILGGVAGDLALTLGSFGGVYIGGGVVNQLGDLFDRDSFRERFVSKGRFADFLAQIPTYLITAQYPAFLGISVLLHHHLQVSEQ